MLNLFESLLDYFVYIGVVIGALLFLFFGYMDITGSSNIGTLSTTVGSIGLMLCAANLLGLITLKRKDPHFHLPIAAPLIGLSLTFMYLSPMRLGVIFGIGDPAKLAATWTAVTGGFMVLLALMQKITGRARSEVDQAEG